MKDTLTANYRRMKEYLKKKKKKKKGGRVEKISDFLVKYEKAATVYKGIKDKYAGRWGQRDSMC